MIKYCWFFVFLLLLCKLENVQVINFLFVVVGIIVILLVLSFFGQVGVVLFVIIFVFIFVMVFNLVVCWLECWMLCFVVGVLIVLLVVLVLVLLGLVVVLLLVLQGSKLMSSLLMSILEFEVQINVFIDRYLVINLVLIEVLVYCLIQQVGLFVVNVVKGLFNIVFIFVGGVFMGLVMLVMVVFVFSNLVLLVNGVLGVVLLCYCLFVVCVLVQIFKQFGGWGCVIVFVMLVIGSCIVFGLMLFKVDNWLIFGILVVFGELVFNIGFIVVIILLVLFVVVDDL